MFLKQYNYKPRSNSSSSQGSTSGSMAGSPPKEELKTANSQAGGPVSSAPAGRRRVCLVLTFYHILAYAVLALTSRELGHPES